MSVLFAAVFNRTNARNKSGLYKVNIRATVNRKQHYLTLQNFPKLKKTHWHKGKVKNSHPHEYVLNNIIQDKIRELDGYVIKSLADGLSVTWPGIKAFHDAESSRIDFLRFATEYIRKAKDIKYSTKRSYNTTIAMLKDFCSSVQLRDIKRGFVENLLQFQKNKPYAAETIRKNMFKFRKLYHEACKLEGMGPDNNLFVGLKLPKSTSNQVRLTQEEVQKIARAKLPDSKLGYLRDIFIFQCYTGLYYSDIGVLDASHIIKNKQGYYITNGRFKNEHVFVIPLWLDPVQMQLLNKYKPEKGLVFADLPHEGTYNKRLKIIAAVAKVDKNIYNKVGRHTFTQYSISRGFPRQFVSRMLGHHKEETTQHYYNVSEDMLLQNIGQFLGR